MNCTVPITTVLYLRLSDGRKENGSFVDREAKLREKAGHLGWTVLRVVIENDMVDGIAKPASAFKRRKVTLADGSKVMRVIRPGFRSILEDLAAGRANAILAEDLDRVIRDPRDAQDLIDAVRGCNGHADSLTGSLKLTAGGTDAERLMLTVLVAFTQKSSADTVRRVTDGRERMAADGRWGGGVRPYGFLPVPNPAGGHQNTRLTVHEGEAAEIRRAVGQVLAKVPLRSIVRDMRQRGVPSVTGAVWLPQTLKDVLLREINAGIVVYKGEETAVKLAGDPILDEDVYRAVVAKLTDPDRCMTPGPARRWLGSGIYRCVCGLLMEVHAKARQAGRTPVYRCRGMKSATNVGPHVTRACEALDRHITDVLIEWCSRPDAAALLSPATPEVDVTALREQAAVLRVKLDVFAQDFGDELITRSQMLAGTTRVKARLAAIEATLSATRVSPAADLAGARNVREAWQRASLGTQRAILAELLDVTVKPTRRGQGFDVDAIEISEKIPAC